MTVTVPSEGMSAVLSASGTCFAFDDSRMLHGLTECSRRLPANMRLALLNTVPLGSPRLAGRLLVLRSSG